MEVIQTQVEVTPNCWYSGTYQAGEKDIIKLTLKSFGLSCLIKNDDFELALQHGIKVQGNNQVMTCPSVTQ